MTTTTGQVADRSERLVFLDNLRTTMIFLVVLYHSGAVYESSGFFGSFWLVDDPATNDLVGMVNVIIDIFTMPVIFFVSGFLAPVSVRGRPGWSFLTRRLRRLMVPWLVAVLTLMPLYKIIFLYSRGLPQEPWTTYLYFNNGGLSQSWLWFLPVLFLFDTVFWSAGKLGWRPPRVPVKAAVTGVFVLGTLYGFSVSMAGLSGWTKTFILDFQNERLLIYFLVFLLGAVCYRERVFDGPPGGKKLYITLAATVWLPMNVYIIVLLTLLFRPGEHLISLPVDLLILWAAFLTSMLSMLYLLVMTFRFWVNRDGPLARFLNPASYSVYIIHMVVVGGIALLLLHVAIPSVAKYAILTLAAYLVSNVIAHVYRIGLKPRLREAVS